MVDQVDIFQPIAQQSEFAELCTVLYERELSQLAHYPAEQISLAQLQARLRSLSYYVKRAARAVLACDSPLALDVQNGSWQGPQKAKLELTASQFKQSPGWFAKHAALGLVVPVTIKTLTHALVRLDSIDRLDTERERFHLNQFGWFSYAGDLLEADYLAPQSAELRVVRPDKSLMTAACCGHQWNHRGKTAPRTLPLRELLLAATIQWRDFKSVVRIAD